jgi:phosphotriesterase-related protein
MDSPMAVFRCRAADMLFRSRRSAATTAPDGIDRGEAGTMMLNTASGTTSIDALGKTLMHEHLKVSFGGWEGDTSVPPTSRADVIKICVDQIEELKAEGYRSLLDPCPNDLGRDVDLLGEVAARTGFTILFAVGLYMDKLSGPYWRLKLAVDPDGEKRLAELYIREIKDGVGSTGIKPAVIKVATGHAPFTRYEQRVMTAAAIAAEATGTPILTHTEGVDGDLQLGFLTERGIAPHKVIVGHSCTNPDHDYHCRIVDAGAFIGFDRFGLTRIRSDEDRLASLAQLIASGRSDKIMISHDCVMHMPGHLAPPGAPGVERSPLHFSRVLAPKLRALGVSQATIDSILTDNPRRYFAG